MATFPTGNLSNTAWVQIVDGATYAKFGVQLDPTSAPVLLAVLPAAPAIGSDNYIVLSRDGDRSFADDLASNESVYARAATKRGGKLRGSRSAR